MKINQYKTTETLQNIKLLGTNDSQTVGIPFKAVKKQVFKDANATPEKDGLMSKEDKAKLDELVETTNLEAVVKSLILASHPVGSIEVNVSGKNPGTYLGGTWVAWGSGRVPVGVNTSDADFSTSEHTGGAKSRTHSHTVPGHTHVIGAHAHLIPNHNHTLSHTHTIPQHNHYVDSHQHTQTMRFQSAYQEAAGGGVKYTNGESVPTNIIYTGSAGQGYTWYTSLTTDGASVASTGTASNMSTNNSSTFNSGNCGDFASDNASFSILQPFVTCYFWKRTK